MSADKHLTIPGALEWDSGSVERLTIATLRYAGGKEHDVRYVSEVDYDAALAREAEVGRLYDSLVNRSNRERDASYKREDALREELDSLRETNRLFAIAHEDSRNHVIKIEQRLTVAEKLLQRVHQADALSHCCPLWKAIEAALNPAAEPDDWDRFARAYPDGFSTCNQIREESGLPTKNPCVACNNGACIDR